MPMGVVDLYCDPELTCDLAWPFSRVAIAPAAVAALTKKGFTVQIQENAGAEASFTNDMFAEAGAKIVDKKTAYGSGMCPVLISGLE